MQDLLADPHLEDVGFFDVGESYRREFIRMVPQPVRFHGVERGGDTPPPALAADTRAVPIECGYTDAEIDRLVALGVAGVESNPRSPS